MRSVPPVAIMLLLHIYAFAEPIRECPAHNQWLRNFLDDGIIRHNFTSGSGYTVTIKGESWVERILGTLPPRAYGGKAVGYWKAGSLDSSYTSLEHARRDVMHAIRVNGYWGGERTYREGGYILQAVELIEPISPPLPDFKTTYLS